MELPNKKLKSIVYEYEDGDKYQIAGQSVDNYLTNIKNASLLHYTHYGNSFKPIEWNKFKSKNDVHKVSKR